MVTQIGSGRAISDAALVSASGNGNRLIPEPSAVTHIPREEA